MGSCSTRSRSALLALFLVQAVFFIVELYLLAYVGQRIVADLRLNVQRHLLMLPLPFYDNRRVGEMVSRVTNDVTVVQAAITETPTRFLRQIVTFVGGLALMLYINWQLTLFILVLIPPLMGIGIFFGRRLERLSTQVQDRLADATTVLDETLSGIRVIKSFGSEAFEEQRFAERVESTFRTAMQRTRVRTQFIPLITFLSFAAVTAIFWFGGRQVLAGALTAGELVAFLFYVFMVAGPLGEFAGLYSQVREALGASRRLFEILDTPAEAVGLATNATPVLATNGHAAATGHVRYREVGFGYAGGRTVLSGIDLDARPGEVIALVGPSGVGKSTLVNLLPRFYEVTTGAIEIDGVDVRQMALPELRALIGLVPQDTFLFGGSVRENIAYGRTDVSDAAVEAAARAAYAHDFIVAIAGRLCNHRGRAWGQALGRAAPARRHCPRPAQGSAHPDSGRGDVGARHRVRAVGAGGAGAADGGAHVAGHRAPAVDRAARRPYPGVAGRAHRGERAACRAVGALANSMRTSGHCNLPTLRRNRAAATDLPTVTTRSQRQSQ